MIRNSRWLDIAVALSGDGLPVKEEAPAAQYSRNVRKNPAVRQSLAINEQRSTKRAALIMVNALDDR